MPMDKRRGRPRQRLAPKILVQGAWFLFLAALSAAVAWGVYTISVPAPAPAPVYAPAPLPPPPAKKPATRAATRPAPVPVPVQGQLQSVAETPTLPPSGPLPGPVQGQSQGQAPAKPRSADPTYDDIEFVASAHSPQVRACYDRAFRNAPAIGPGQAPAGRVELSFVLVDTGSGGRAVSIATELNLLGDAAVAACLEERLSEWEFPRPRLGPPRRLRFPFVFAPAQ